MKLIFATNNEHKLQEVREILGSRFSVLSLKEVGFHEEIEETADTLEGNSRLKAETIWNRFGGEGVCVLADDTGLEITALDNAPGVYSARYAGEPSNPAKNRQKVLEQMLGKENREARFRTVLTLMKTSVQQFEGIVEGDILCEEHGEHGFGYDAIFQPKGYDCSFAQMQAEEKNAISHRGRAIQKLVKYLLPCVLCVWVFTNAFAGLPIYSWRTHFAYTNVTEVEQAGTLTYALSNGALFSVEDGEIRTYDRLNGLNGNHIVTIRYAEYIHALLLFYDDGNIDFLYDNGSIVNMPDLKNKETNLNKRVQHCYIEKAQAYLSMPFGILVLNLTKREVANTYYIGEEGQAAAVFCTAIHQDTIFAKMEMHTLYALLSDNLVDYHNWHVLAADYPTPFTEPRIDPNTLNAYLPDGPVTNTPYDMTYANDYIYVVPGGRWAVQYRQAAHLMRYDGNHWENLTQKQLESKTGKQALDFMNVATDPANASHCFVTSYGTGLYEIQDMELKQHLTAANSLLESAAPSLPDNYTRTAGACYDTKGNLWLLNAGEVTYNILVIAPDGTQYGGNVKDANGATIPLHTPNKILQDRLRANYKWFTTGRMAPGLGLLDDNGTPTDLRDDRTIFRSTFHHGTTLLAPEFIYCAAQDLDGTIWLGTTEGVYTFSSYHDFFQTDECSRPTIARADGSTAAGGAMLADYLLQNEAVKCIAVDGANRKWIGTESAGLFLMSPDGTVTIEHFTKENSPLPSDNILSLAIHERTGELFIGTGEGLLSYQSDANESSEDLQNMYAYPNPVKENYTGVVTITGLINGGEVRIVNNAGQVVYSTTALGGLATWEPNHAATGVYTVQCYDPENNLHGSTKVLIIKQ